MSSPKLVKIKDVHLYVGLVANGHECDEAKNVLDAAGVKYTLLSYADESQHPSVFQALNTWNWGSERKPRVLSQFPLIHWTSCYDDFEQYQFVAHGLDEIKTSELINNANLTG